jgi:hypothetical protein
MSVVGTNISYWVLAVIFALRQTLSLKSSKSNELNQVSCLWQYPSLYPSSWNNIVGTESNTSDLIVPYGLILYNLHK